MENKKSPEHIIKLIHQIKIVIKYAEKLLKSIHFINIISNNTRLVEKCEYTIKC